METRKYFHWEQKAAAKSIAASLRKRGIQCAVLNGNGSTSPKGSDEMDNYFIIEPENRGNRYYMRDELFLNFALTEENAQKIKAALEDAAIPYQWDGSIYHTFMFKTSDFIKP